MRRSVEIKGKIASSNSLELCIAKASSRLAAMEFGPVVSEGVVLLCKIDRRILGYNV